MSKTMPKSMLKTMSKTMPNAAATTTPKVAVKSMPKISVKRLLLTSAVSGALLSLATPALADLDKDSYQLSSHVLDISTGKPAPNVKIQLMMQQKNGTWTLLNAKRTDENGRVNDFLPGNASHEGTYKLIFETTPYFFKQGVKSFYPYIEVNFKIEDDAHYHVPITLSPYGYSTYRGS